MRYLRVALAYVLVASLVFIGMPLVPVQAQVPAALSSYLNGAPVVRGIAAISTDVAILVKYTGSSASGSVAVDAATGDLTFTSGATGSEAAEDAFECPVSGALGGVIDVSNAACNTLGEVVDTINGNCTGCTQGEWTAVLLGGLRADSSNNTLVTISATAANSPEGLGLATDGAVSFTTTQVISPMQELNDGYVTGRSTIVENPFANSQAVLFQLAATSTYGSGASYHQVICADVKNKRVGASETTRTFQLAAGATTVEGKLTYDGGLACPTGQKMLVRTYNDTAMTASTLYAFGRVWNP